MDKIFKDRLNCLKSQLQSAKGFKLTKTINISLVSELEGRIKELIHLSSLLKKKDLYE